MMWQMCIVTSSEMGAHILQIFLDPDLFHASFKNIKVIT